MTQVTRVHGTCVSRDGAGVLLLGPPGAGKSDLALRLLARGFELVADDQVLLEDGGAHAPSAVFGLLEVRGLGILRLPCASAVRLALVVELGDDPERLPEPRRHDLSGVPVIGVRAEAASAPERVAIALDCALGKIAQVSGAFAA